MKSKSGIAHWREVNIQMLREEGREGEKEGEREGKRDRERER